MATVRIEQEYEKNTETGEEIGHPQIWVWEGDERQEAFWLTEEDDDESMRANGFLPIEELFPGTTIEGYAEIHEVLYAKKRS